MLWPWILGRKTIVPFIKKMQLKKGLQMHFWLFPLNYALYYEDNNGQIQFAHNYCSYAILN